MIENGIRIVKQSSIPVRFLGQRLNISVVLS